MPVPVGQIPPALAEYLQALEDRMAARELASEPYPVFACPTVGMPAAASYRNCVLLNTTLGVLCVSNGTAWVRQDTGAAI